MVQQINIGNQSNDGTGDSIRDAFRKVNQNFAELYATAGLGDGLKFTNLNDTPKQLLASSTSSATIFVVDNFGGITGTLTQKSMVAGQGIVISNTASDKITISAPFSSLASDANPTLAADIDGNGHYAKNFNDPIEGSDLATKYYVDNNSPYSVVNLYVSLNGSDTRNDIPSTKRGRSLGYAFRTVNYACQIAEGIISTSTLDLSSYQQYMTLNEGDTTASIYTSIPSPEIPGATRIFVDYGLYGATDQYKAKAIRPGQYIKGEFSDTIGFINTLGHATTGTGIPNYDETLCYRDSGLIVDAVAQDLLFNGTSQSTFAGIQYWAQGSTSIPNELTTTTNAITYLKGLATKIIRSDISGTRYQSGVSQTTSTNTGTTADGIALDADFDVILGILANGNVYGVTDSIIPNGLTATVVTNTLNAYALLQANKAYLAAEVDAFVTATNSGFVYDSVKCTRDVGYMIDSVSFDLKYGGNKQAVQSGVYYYGHDGLTSVIPNEGTQVVGAFNFIRGLVDNVIRGELVGTPNQTAVHQFISANTGTSAEVTAVQALMDNITNIITNGPGAAAAPAPIGLVASGSTPVTNAAVLLEQNRAFIQAETIAWIGKNYGTTVYEFYDVTFSEDGAAYLPGEYLLFANKVPKQHITIFIETGVYEEQLPIRVPSNTSIKGDEFRRVIIKPAQGMSTSKWNKLFFRRDDNFDGLNRLSNHARTNLANPGLQFGYHYLTDPTDVTSPAKLNNDMDMFLLNDATILRSISGQGHGGFMCVFDPEGQILTKSPYFQNCTSFSKSVNKQTFSGGMLVDGFAGNLRINPADSTTYFTGTTTISVTGLTHRQPQTPVSFYNLGNRYEVDYVTDLTSGGTALLHLNPYLAGGIAFPNGIIPIASGGIGYSSVPAVVFSQPASAGGYGAQGTATVVGGVITQVNITNPGTGYVGSATIQFVGGNPISAAPTQTISTSSIKVGFIGRFPGNIELGTAGNKTMLAADYTQVNDLGYGIVATNNGIVEAVSVFTYYCHAGYYSLNGGQIRSLGGSTGFGNYALKAEGSDPNEVPIPVSLAYDMVQTATVVSYNYAPIGGVNTLNTGGSTTLFIRNPSSGYTPFNQSEIEIDHGMTVDSLGNYIGVQVYPVISASTVSNTTIPGLIQLNLSQGLGGLSGGLKSSVTSGTIITVRSENVTLFNGITAATLVRNNTALLFDESTTTVHRVLGAPDGVGAPAGSSKLIFQYPFNYVPVATYTGRMAASGATTIDVRALSDIDEGRINGSTSSSITQLSFAWGGQIHKITGYASPTYTGQLWGQIRITPALNSTVTNWGNSDPYGGISLPAGLRQLAPAKVYTRISTMRATSADMVNIGAGSFEDSRIPPDVLGPQVNPTNPAYERVEVGTGRVFAVTSDQDGNFKVGDYLTVNQGAGDVSINANISLTKVSGLGFLRGTIVREFSDDEYMLNNSPDTVSVQSAMVKYISHRLGLNQVGTTIDRVGPGFLDLTGVQHMDGNLQMAGWAINMAGYTGGLDGGTSGRVLNMSTGTNFMDAVNKGQLDTRISLAGKSDTGPYSTATNNAYLGIMTGQLQLARDPLPTDDHGDAATKRYVDRYARQFSTMTDVSLSSPGNTDILMFSSTPITFNTGTAMPVWNATQQIINVRNNVTLPTPTSTAAGGGSDVSFVRSANTVTIKLVGGLGANNPITDYHINTNAAIVQSKLSMKMADTGSTSSLIVQADLGLAKFDSGYFETPNGVGWVSIKKDTALNMDVYSAGRVNHKLQMGTYLKLQPGATSTSTFNGSADAYWSVDGTSTNVISTVVVRDGSGNFAAKKVTAETFEGTATWSTYASVAVVAQSASGSAASADKVANALSAGSSISMGASFDGSAAVTINTIQDIRTTANPTFGIVYANLSGNATSANYADLAENYLADAAYEPGTVLEFGGEMEVTIAEDGTRRVAGIVSTNPAHLMNGKLEGDFVVALGLTGRVPCKVRGQVRKGDMMVSAGSGFARAEYNPVLGSVIGKALENFDGGEGVIEVVVGRM